MISLYNSSNALRDVKGHRFSYNMLQNHRATINDDVVLCGREEWVNTQRIFPE